jgi:hypothetical protein
MKEIIPKYPGWLVLIQAVMVIIFSFALYFFLHFGEEKKRIMAELTILASQRQQLEQIQENISRYRKAVAADTALCPSGSKLLWEEVEFYWQDIDLSELPARLVSLNLQERIFVLESFKTGIKRAGDTTTVEERSHHLQGYFLCPFL